MGTQTLRIGLAASGLIVVLLTSPDVLLAFQRDLGQGWDLSSASRLVYDSNIEHDEEKKDAAGAVLESEISWRSSSRPPAVEAGYEIGIHRYTREDPWSRVTHELGATFEARPARHWRLGLTAEILLNGSSEDRDLSDNYIVGPRISWHPSDRWRIRLSPTYRYRRFEDRDYEYAHQPYVQLEIRRERTDRLQWELATRYDTRRTPTAEDRYHRWRQQLRIEQPVTPNDELNLVVGYRYRTYPERDRRDHTWEASIEWDHRLRQYLDIRAGYEFETHFSNDEDKDFIAHRITVGLDVDWPL